LRKRHEQFGKATYDLDALKKLIKEGKYDITRICRKEFTRLDYSSSEVIRIIKNLKKSQIHKTMPAIKAPDLMQDVYHTMVGDDSLYIKLQEGSCGNKCIIIQFKLG